MIKTAIAITTALLCGISIANTALADDIGTANESVAIVNKVKADLSANGADKTIADVNGKTYNVKDLYPFIYDPNGLTLAHGANAALVGKNIIELKDPDGKFVIKDIVALGKSGKPGWIDYKWPNPATKKIAAKSTYVDSVQNYIIGVGYYPQK